MFRKRTRAAVLAAAIAAGAALAAPASAHAATAIGPGDTIRYITSNTSSTCTLGFTFRAYGRTFGVTAGHCVAEDRGYILDANTGDRGRIINYDYDRTREGNDYALIDFGAAPVASTLLDTRIAAATAPPADSTICHTGIASGTSCATLAARYGNQYLTTAIADSPGDSGGPVWTRYGIDELAIVGIWLGAHRDETGATYGRFFPIKEALTGLGLQTAADRAGRA
ncbi:trypsin-like peptidase domain-containing protein [Mycobacteroides chelonae]|uniref:trypsin-like peptidase domain-containing protein n=1 Tax=Mycobacteroides chelonae TaxID=1774 RepID=UPI0039ECB8B1